MRSLLSLFVLLSLAGTDFRDASAAFINVVAATASNNDPDSGGAIATVNGSGFTPNVLNANQGSHEANIAFHWLGGPGTGTTTTIRHDLYYQFDSLQTLESILFWNYNDPALLSRGVRSLFIHTSTDSAAFDNDSHPDWSPTALLSPTDIPQGPGDGSFYGTVFDVPNTEALVVRFRTFQSWGNVANIGFAETRFVTTAVPEPSSLLLVAASVMTLSVRRRR